MKIEVKLHLVADYEYTKMYLEQKAKLANVR